MCSLFPEAAAAVSLSVSWPYGNLDDDPIFSSATKSYNHSWYCKWGYTLNYIMPELLQLWAVVSLGYEYFTLVFQRVQKTLIFLLQLFAFYCRESRDGPFCRSYSLEAIPAVSGWEHTLDRSKVHPWMRTHHPTRTHHPVKLMLFLGCRGNWSSRNIMYH